MPANYLTVYHIYTNVPDYVEAIITADEIRTRIEAQLIDTDAEESVEVVQTIPLEEDPTPSATLTQLRRARNILIRLRTKESFGVARELDMMVHALSQRLAPEDATTNYDWSTFIGVTRDVLSGGNPLDS